MWQVTIADAGNSIPGLPGEAQELIKALVSASGLAAFLSWIVPGLIAIVVYDLRVPGERRKYSDGIVAIVGYSAVFDVIGYGAALLFPKMGTWLFIGVFSIVLPAIAGWFAGDVRSWLSWTGVLSPYPTAWDALFARLGATDELFALSITLNDGRVVGGIYAKGSCVSTYPAESDILISSPCEIDQSSGRFLGVINQRFGLYLKGCDIAGIEVLTLAAAFGRDEPTA